MSYRYTVMGAGRQGAAIAYDLVRCGQAEHVRLLDQDGERAREVAQRVNALTNRTALEAEEFRATDAASIQEYVRGSHAIVSALPYFLNVAAAEAAVATGAHFTDLGGNTEVVQKELELDAGAKKAGMSLLPDCGLAPGLSNLLAARAVETLGRVRKLQVRCGGLPQIPRPPFFYKMLFSLDGLVNEYSGEAICLRNGEITRVPTLTEIETVEVPSLGSLEAAVTSGGTSTAPFSFQGRVENFEYKTLRHPGHWGAMKAFKDLGLFSTQPLPQGSGEIIPREVFKTLLQPWIDFPHDRDLVVLTVEAEGEKGRYRALLIDRGSAKDGFTAMERTTGYPTAAIAHLQAMGKIPAGAAPIEKAVPLSVFLKEIARRGIEIREEQE